MRATAAGLLALLIAAPAAGLAQPVAAPPPEPITGSKLVNDGRGVLVVRGQRAVVRVAADGGLSLVSVSNLDAATLALPLIQNGTKPSPEVAQALKVTAASDTLVLSLGGTEATGSLLKLENGLDRHIAYRANIVRVSAGKAAAASTSVCSVLPHIVAWERWPEPVVAVVASAFADQAGAPVCR